MKTLWLYGGTPKTATTTVQHFLVANRPALAERGVAYPDMSDLFGKPNNPRNANWLTNSRRWGERRQEGFRRVRALLGEYDTVVLSDELLWKYRFTQAEFFDFVRAGVPPETVVKVLVFLRRQDQFLYSSWEQAVKSRPERDESHLEFLDYVEQKQEKKRQLDYAGTLAIIESAVGAENMAVRTFEPARYKDGGTSVCDEALEALGIDGTGEWVESGRVRNVGMRDVVLETKRLMNYNGETAQMKFGGGHEKLRQALLHVQRELEEEDLLGRRTGFPDEKRRDIMEHYAEGNATVARRYLGREDGVLFDCTDIEEGTGGEAMRPYTTEEIARVFTRVIAEFARRLDRAEGTAEFEGPGAEAGV